MSGSEMTERNQITGKQPEQETVYGSAAGKNAAAEDKAESSGNCGQEKVRRSRRVRNLDNFIYPQQIWQSVSGNHVKPL